MEQPTMIEEEQKPKKPFVFVYGSLRHGCYNHTLLVDKASRIGNIWELEGYSLYSFGSYPAVYPSLNKQDVVVGEVYEITDDKIMDYIDRMESNAGYDKKVELVKDGDEVMIVYVYVYGSARITKRELVEHGDWNLHLALTAKPEVADSQNSEENT